MNTNAFLRFDGYIAAAIVVVIAAIAVMLLVPLSVDMVFITAAAGMVLVGLLVGLSSANAKIWNWILFATNLALLVATWLAARAHMH